MIAIIINLVSMNMAMDNGDPERRFGDFGVLMRASPPELIVVQEVSAHLGQRALVGLVKSLGGDYTLSYQEGVYPAQKDEDDGGLAVITSLPVIGSRATKLSSGGNQAQIVELGSRYSRIVLANVHLEAAPKEERFRHRKVGDLADELQDTYKEKPQIIAGDFNALPFFPTILRMKNRGYTSAFEFVHGREPHHTFPTMDPDVLQKGKYMKHGEISKLRKVARITNLFRRLREEIPHYTTDYVFLKHIPLPIRAELITGKDKNSEPISDHMGLRVRLPAVAT